MGRRWLSATLVLLGLLAGLGLSQCYAPSYADCAFRCGSTAPLCPDEYQCQADGYCHRPGSTTKCAIALDLATASDLGADAAVVDSAGSD
jgi:hypothetical protein